MTTETILSPEIEKRADDLLNQMGKEIEGETVTVYWGQRSSRDDRDVAEQVEAMGYEAYVDSLREGNIDYFHEGYIEARAEAKSSVKDELLDLYDDCGSDRECIALEEYIDQGLADYFPQEDLNLGALFDYTIKVRIALYSNYDCINSHYLNMQEGGYNPGNKLHGTYFGDMLDALGLEPYDFHQAAPALCDDDADWEFRMSSRTPKVTMASFIAELQDSCCGANLLTVFVEVNAHEYYEAQTFGGGWGKDGVDVPQGTKIGLFSSFQGGGSLIEIARTDEPWKLTLAESFDEDYNWHWGIDEGGYGYDDVY